AAMPNRGAEPPHDHEEGTLQEATAVTPGRVGAALSGNAGILALSRAVEKCYASGASRHHPSPRPTGLDLPRRLVLQTLPRGRASPARSEAHHLRHHLADARGRH